MRTQVLVTSVDLTLGSCDVLDSSGGTFQAAIDKSLTVNRIPAVGEVWTVVRHGYIWHLQGRIDNLAFTVSLPRYAEGDVVVDADGDLYLRGSSLQLNGIPMGSPACDTFVSDEGGSYPLTTTPVSLASVRVQYGMAVLNPAEFDIEGETLVIYADFASGIPISCYYERSSSTLHQQATMSILAVPSGVEDYTPAP